MKYAIVETGGKQYRVSPGQAITVDLPGEKGAEVVLDRVLAVAEEGRLTVGSPYVDGAQVRAQVVEVGKGEKIRVFKFKAKTRYHRLKGHRQPFTRLLIQEISYGA